MPKKKSVTMNTKIEKEVLSAETARKYWRYDPHSGTVYWKEREFERGLADAQVVGFNTRFAGHECGRISQNGYRTVAITLGDIAYRDISVARLCWLLHHGEWPQGLMTHVDRDPLNNRIENLIDISRPDLQKRFSGSSANTSGYTGVSMLAKRAHLPDPWTAQIQSDNRTYYLGSFATKEEASARYQSARNWLGHGTKGEDDKGFNHKSGLECPRRGHNGD